MGQSERALNISETVDEPARSTLVSRNITVCGRRTSVRLEPEMWSALRDIAKREQCRIHDVCSLIDMRKNPRTSLTAAIRVFLMLYFRAATSEEGHIRARHGNFRNMLDRARVSRSQMIEKSDRIMIVPTVTTEKAHTGILRA